MKSDKWFKFKGLTDKADQLKEIERIDGTKPEDSYRLNTEFYAFDNDAFTEVEKGPKIRYMAS